MIKQELEKTTEVTEPAPAEPTPAAATETPAEKKEKETVEVVDVAFRNSGKNYFFSPGDLTFSLGEKVIVETSR